MKDETVILVFDKIRNKVREERKRKGLSVRKLAAMADCEPAMIQEFEVDGRDIRTTNLIKIVLALEIDLFDNI